MPLVRFPTPTGLVYTIDLSKIADRANPRTVEAPIYGYYQEDIYVDWGDGNTEKFEKTGDASSQGNGAQYPTHTYAEGAGDIFQIVIRSTTGRLPLLRFTDTTNTSVAGLTYNVTVAITACDHFCGFTGPESIQSHGSMFKLAPNLSYIDTRLAGLWKWSAINVWFSECVNLEQPIGSFCLDFAPLANDGLRYTFEKCRKLYGDIPSGFLDNNTSLASAHGAFMYTAITSIPNDLFDKCAALTTLFQTFVGCTSITSAPYIFWKEDGSLDTNKLPNLTNGNNCYINCSSTLRAQVPTDYGGTMTV